MNVAFILVDVPLSKRLMYRLFNVVMKLYYPFTFTVIGRAESTSGETLVNNDVESR